MYMCIASETGTYISWVDVTDWSSVRPS